MRMIYSVSLAKEVVESYFRTYEDIDGELEIKCDKKTLPAIGRSLVCQEVPTISFILKGSMEVEGEMQKVEINLSEQDVENAFIARVEASGRKVNKVSINYDENEFMGVVVDATAKRKVRK